MIERGLRYLNSTRKGDPIAKDLVTEVQRGAYDPIEYVRRHTDSTRKGDPITNALNRIVLKNPKELSTTRANWRANDSIKVNGPCCQATGGCITKGLVGQLTLDSKHSSS